jgi:two-component system sensor histidine kinase RegB
MGLLASGAAHELGTPLATVSVILGDWKRMPEISQRADMLEDIAEMEAQLQRCKSIVSGVLLSAGEARGILHQDHHQHLPRQRCRRLAQDAPGGDLRIPQPDRDVPVAFDSAIKQMLGNVLDNAFEVSPQWLALEAQGGSLLMEVSDRAPASRLDDQPDRQALPVHQGQAGRGLGLFFVVNVARKLGGRVWASNLPPVRASRWSCRCRPSAWHR